MATTSVIAVTSATPLTSPWKMVANTGVSTAAACAWTASAKVSCAAAVQFTVVCVLQIRATCAAQRSEDVLKLSRR